MSAGPMNAERLLSAYEKIADAPDAIARLRRFVLDLAVRGKLAPQDANDEPASELLKRIEKEKARLVKAREARKLEVDPVALGDQPFALPSAWTWTRLGAIGDWGSGSTPPRGASGLYGGNVTWLKSGELNDNRALGGSEETVTETAIAKGSFRINKPGDVLIAMYGATIGKVAILAESAVTNQAVCGCTPFAGVFNQFLFLFLLSQREQFHSASEGGAQPNISKVKIVWTPFPLPPLAEQERIVARVDELMGLCDRLEATRAGREATRDRLAAASLARLDAPDPETFEADARFALDALPALTTRPDQIKRLRQTILNLAVRGRLAPQDAKDEPASDLLKRIAKEKARLVKAGEIRKPKVLADVEEPPFDLPQNWCWTPIREATSDRGQEIPQSTFTYIDVTAIDKEAGIVAEPKVLEVSEAPSRARKITRKGDVVYSCVRPYLLNVAVIECDFDPQPIASTAFAILNGHGLVMPRYIWIVLRSPFMVECVEESQRGQAYPAINDADFAVLPFPLPPLAEQRRIVARVDELMGLCDRLEASLAATVETRRCLLDALLAEALAPVDAAERQAAE